MGGAAGATSMRAVPVAILKTGAIMSLDVLRRPGACSRTALNSAAAELEVTADASWFHERSFGAERKPAILMNVHSAARKHRLLSTIRISR